MPSLIVIAGPAGAGKSTAAATLARSRGATLLGKDALTRPLAEALLIMHGCHADDRESDTYRTHVRPVEYAVLEAAMWTCLDMAFDVVCEAPFVRELHDDAWVRHLRRGCRERGARLRIAWLDATPDCIRQRLHRRGADRDRGKLAAWEHYRAQWPTPPACADQVIDTTGMAPQEVAAALAI